MRTWARWVRPAALFALPPALLVSPTVAAVLATLVAIIGTVRRPLRPSPAVYGLLVVGLAAAGNAYLIGLASARTSPFLAGPFGTWLAWLAGASLLGFLYTRLSSQDAPTLALGSAVAGLTAAALATYQVALSGEPQAKLLTFHPNLAAAALTATSGGILVGFVRVWRSNWWGAAIVTLGLTAALIALALTGSRSGLLGEAAGLALFLLLLLPQLTSKLRGRSAIIAVALALLLSVGAGYLNRILQGPASPNLIVNSGFDQGRLPWRLTSGSAREYLGSGTWATHLIREEPNGVLAMYLVALPLSHEPRGALGDKVLSMDVRPGPLAPLPAPQPATAAPPPLPVTLSLDALDADGSLVARLGVEGWLEAPDNDMRSVGGRPRLPQEPIGRWQRIQVAVPPPPPGAASLRLLFTAASSQQGSYGLTDNVMLAPPAVSTYVAGRRPGLVAFLTPAARRLEGLRHPFAAAGGRIGMWTLGLDLASARPVLGYGPGSEHALAHIYAAERVRRPLQHFHSLYLKLLLEGGSALLATALVLLGTLLLTTLRAALRRAPGSAAAAATITALMVQNVFDPTLAYGSVILGLWLVVGVAGSDTTATVSRHG